MRLVVNGHLVGTTPTGDAEGQPDHAADEEAGPPMKREEEANVVESVAQFLRALVECRLADPVVSSFLAYVGRCSSLNNLQSPIDFPSDHPIEEVARCVSLFLFFRYFSESPETRVSSDEFKDGKGKVGQKVESPRKVVRIVFVLVV